MLACLLACLPASLPARPPAYFILLFGVFLCTHYTAESDQGAKYSWFVLV